MPAMHETKIHGRLSFPYAVYGGMLPELFNSFPLHWHDDMEIIYVVRGAVLVSVQNTEYIVHEKEIVLIQPQLIHSIRQSDSEHAVYFNIMFRLSLLENNSKDICYEKYLDPIYSRKVIVTKYLGLEHELNSVIAPYVRRLIDLHMKGDGNNELIIKSHLFAIMHYISKYCTHPDSEDDYLINLYERLKKSLLYVQNNYQENISVKRAAGLSNFSASHFAKMFKQLTGTSFTQYLKNYRLEVAAEKILNNTSRISEIAYECGFNNLSYFTRSFREKYGVTPNHFARAQAVNI